MTTLLRRYTSGEYERVWAEMIAGTDKNGVPIPPSEAEAVAQETMRRVRSNLEVIVKRLKAIGFEFGRYPDGDEMGQVRKPLGAPSPTIERRLTKLEAKAGLVPRSLKAFWREVGSINLTGFKEGWSPNEYWNQLWVDNIDMALWSFEEWREIVKEEGAEEAGPFLLILSPDFYHKANVSGGREYGIIIPNAAADAPFQNDLREETFVKHLRHSLHWGGFPGFEGKINAPHEDIALLRDGLLPI